MTGLLFIVTLLHILVPATVIFVVLARSSWEINQRSLLFPITEKINNYVAVVSFLLPLVYSILTLLHTNTGCCGAWQWHFGLSAFIFCWAHLIRLFSKFPFIGEQSIVFLTIVRTFLKLSIFGLLLVLAAVANCLDGGVFRPTSCSKFSSPSPLTVHCDNFCPL